MRSSSIAAVLLLVAFAVVLVSREPKGDDRLKHATRHEQNGWIYVRLEGAPAMIGFQHGYLLAPEIADAQRAVALDLEHSTRKNWAFFRDAARDVLWPRIEQEYRQELQGIVEGLNAHGMKLDLWDITALNAFNEFDPYYVRWWEKEHAGTVSSRLTAPEHCSAFVATGSYTRDGRPVIGHNNWTNYAEGARWNIIFDIVPQRGYHILMDGFPGLIHSADDFGINSAGIMITETTISQFFGYDPAGVPEFVRARKAMQYAASIDDFARLMKEGNNGGYANNWLVADRNTNEIADLELGLKNVNLRRTRDGYFEGSNFPVDPKLAREETEFNLNNPSLSPNARRVRWRELLEENKGKIDIAAGERFLTDHYDTFEKKTQPSERTLCGHIDLSARGSKPWQAEYGPAGTVQNKITDAALAGKMSLVAAMGHACGIDFKAAAHLEAHPEFAWARPCLRDLKAHAWTEFRAADSPR